MPSILDIFQIVCNFSRVNFAPASPHKLPCDGGYSVGAFFQALAWLVPSLGLSALKQIYLSAQRQAMPSWLAAPPIPFALSSPKERASQL